MHRAVAATVCEISMHACVCAYQCEHAIVAVQIGLERVIARLGQRGNDREAATTQRGVGVLRWKGGERSTREDTIV